jgi:hypothetical protein
MLLRRFVGALAMDVARWRLRERKLKMHYGMILHVLICGPGRD